MKLLITSLLALCSTIAFAGQHKANGTLVLNRDFALNLPGAGGTSFHYHEDKLFGSEDCKLNISANRPLTLRKGQALTGLFEFTDRAYIEGGKYNRIATTSVDFKSTDGIVMSVGCTVMGFPVDPDDVPTMGELWKDLTPYFHTR